MEMKMAQAEHFDALVLGSGPGGNLLAWHLAPSGQRVAVVERRYIGGSCPNIACMPSKNEVWSARIAYLTRRAAQFGTITGPVTTDMAKCVSASAPWSSERSPTTSRPSSRAAPN
jgi:pyruvate/2-oxoglutarate dehydrogenase complex dihydrolipoamide dehydrogenase (E3) component